jgi:hypothetical protein
MFYWLWRVRFRRTYSDARWASNAISQNSTDASDEQRTDMLMTRAVPKE